MTDAKQTLKQDIVRMIHKRDQLIPNCSPDYVSQQPTPQEVTRGEREFQQLDTLQRNLIARKSADSHAEGNGCDWFSLGLTCLTCALFCCGFYFSLFHGLFPSEGESSELAAKLGIFTLCAATSALLLHLLVCFARVALNSTPSQRELELFTEFSRRCKMLTGVAEVESDEQELNGDDAS